MWDWIVNRWKNAVNADKSWLDHPSTGPSSGGGSSWDYTPEGARKVADQEEAQKQSMYMAYALMGFVAIVLVKLIGGR